MLGVSQQHRANQLVESTIPSQSNAGPCWDNNQSQLREIPEALLPFPVDKLEAAWCQRFGCLHKDVQKLKEGAAGTALLKADSDALFHINNPCLIRCHNRLCEGKIGNHCW